MPTYQYACTSCDERLEVVQSFSDDPLTVCPACEGRLRKLFSAVGVVFKGSGFYKTDSRSARKPAAATASTSGEGSSATETSTSPSGGGSDSGTPTKSGEAKGSEPKSSDRKSGDRKSPGSTGDKVA